MAQVNALFPPDPPETSEVAAAHRLIRAEALGLGVEVLTTSAVA